MARFFPDGGPRVSRLELPEVLTGRGWTWPQLRFVLENEHRWLLVDDLAAQPWLVDALIDPCVYPSVRKGEGAFTGITARFYRRSARIQDAKAVWGAPASQALVNRLTKLFEHCGAGIWAYPSTLGLEMMRRDWPAEFDPQPAPLSRCWADLQQNMIGGRVDTLRLGETFPLATEIDMNMAYPAAICDVPAGYPRQTYQADPDYGHYNWRIHEPVQLGPLPVRLPDGDLTYPRHGEGHGWYWREEVEQARVLGVECIADYGWTWEKRTNAWQGWAEHMHSLRWSAPKGVDDLVKVVAVAAIGALGMTGERARLVRNGFPHSEPLFSPYTGFDPHWSVWFSKPCPGGMLHVASYVRAKVRTWLFAAALPYAGKGLISTDYDAIRVAGAVKVASTKALGGWKARRLHNVTVPKARWIVSDEKIRTPGVSR